LRRANKAILQPRLNYQGGQMTRFLKTFFALLLLSVLAATIDPVLADDFLGGGGGSPFPPVLCPAGTVVIGLKGKAGAVLNTIQLLCGKANGADGDNPYGLITSADTNPDPKDPNSEAFRGGGLASAPCPSLMAAKSIEVSMKKWREKYVVSQIKLTCVYLGGGGSDIKVYGHDDGIGRVPAKFANGKGPDVLSCPEHQLMNGLQGRHGTWIDAVGINCVPTASLQGG
jgi:hypothetical protein